MDKKNKLTFPGSDTRKLLSLTIIFIFLANFFIFVSAVNGSDTIFIMPLGDSITLGDNMGGYRRKIFLDLTNVGFNVDLVGSLSDPDSQEFDIDHEGHSGWHVDQIRDNVYNWLELNPADIVLLHIGTNDISQGNENVGEVEEILDEIDRYSKDVTVILALIILRTDNSTKNETTKAYNIAIKTMAQYRIDNVGDDIIIVDMENALSYPEDIDDNVHPNSVGYEKMGDAWYNAIYDRLITIKPIAEFTAFPTSGFTPLNVTFNDQTTSYDGIVSWIWNFGDGQTSTNQNPIHTFPVGTYTVSLTVEEADGDTNTETKPNIIKVLPLPNSFPVADFNIQSSTKPAINETISFTDRSSDTNGIITSWNWNFGDKATIAIQNPLHKYESPGTYTVTLTVKNDDGATGTKTKQIIIHEVYAPVTTDDYDRLWHNSDFTITLVANDDYSGVAETYYQINGESTKQLSIDGQPRITTEDFNNKLEYWSVDNVGNEENHHIVENMQLDKSPPTADSGQDTIVSEDTIMNFDGQNSNDNLLITNYTWELFDGDLQTLTGPKPQYIFHTPGKYTVNLTVTDAALNSAMDTITITVLDITAPTPYAGDDRVINQRNTVTFDASQSYDNTGIASYTWIFGDGTVENTSVPTVIHNFDEPRTYDVELVITDIVGNVNSAFIRIVVQKDTDGDLLADHLDEDDDGDILPDVWELNYRLDPLDPSDATLDMDGDGISNLKEYQKNTDPSAYDFSAYTLSILLVGIILLSLIFFGIFIFKRSRTIIK